MIYSKRKNYLKNVFINSFKNEIKKKKNSFRIKLKQTKRALLLFLTVFRHFKLFI